MYQLSLDQIDQMFLEKKILFYLLFFYYLLLKKGVDLQLNELKSPKTKDALCQVCWNWPSGSGEDENVKSLQMDRQKTMDNRWSENVTGAISLGELKTSTG